jgi:hypothetical protein
MTTSYTDSDTSKSLEYRVTALPGSVVAKSFLGSYYDPPTFSEDFNSYSDGTRLASRYQTGVGTYANTASPHISGWDAIGWQNGDADTTGFCQMLRIYNGKVQQTYSNTSGAWNTATVRDFGAPGGIWEITLCLEDAAGTEQNPQFIFSANSPDGSTPTGIRVLVRSDKLYAQWIRITAGSVDIIISSLPSPWQDGDKLKIKIDDTAKRIYAFQNNVAAGDPAGYDLSAWTGPWTSKSGFTNQYTGNRPPAGDNLINALTYTSLLSNTISSAIINVQSGGLPYQKQIDITANISATGATGAQYKIETESGEFVTDWTSMTLSGTTATATALLSDHVHEGEKFRILVRNVGGSVNTGSYLTAPNGYVLDQKMRLGLNDSFDDYWGNQLPGRDLFLSSTHALCVMTTGSTSDRVGVIAKGQDFSPNYGNWNLPYSPTQLYPDVDGSDNYRCCVYNGIQFRRTVATARSGVAPSTSDPSGSTTGWALYGYCSANTVNLSEGGLPTKLPDDPNLTIAYFPPWKLPSARYPATFHCKTQPGVKWNLAASAGGCTMQNANTSAGTFDIVYTSDSNPFLRVDRSTPIGNTFFISGVPTWETGGPAPDIGIPYAGMDKIGDYSPFYGRRNIHGDQVIEIFVTTPVGGFSAINNVPSGGRMEWKASADLANQSGHKMIWVNIPDLADDTYIDAQATFYRDHLNSGIDVYVEVGNERWNWSYYSPTLLLNRSRALDPSDPAYSPSNGDNKHLLHARETATKVARWKAVWGSQSNRVKGVLAWQTATSINTWKAMLDIDGNAYQHIDVIATAPYMNVDGSGHDVGSYTNTPQNIRDAVVASNQTNFNTYADIQMRSALSYEVGLTKTLFDWIPSYSVSKGLNKNSIGLVSYEASQHIVVTEKNWDDALGAGMGARATAMTSAYKQSSTYATTHAYYIDQMALTCPHLMMLFDYVGTQGSTAWWAHTDRTGNRTIEPYATAKAKALSYNAA